jgi:hypothetical protein
MYYSNIFSDYAIFGYILSVLSIYEGDIMSEQLPPVSAPAPIAAPARNGNGFAIASLVLGILSLCGSVSVWCGGILSVVGIVLGALGMNSKGKGMAIAGIILAALGLILTILFRIVFRGIFLNNYLPQFLQNNGF